MQGPFKSNKALKYPSGCLFVWSLTILKRLNNWDEIWMEDSLLYRDGFRLKIWIRQFKLRFISTIFKDKILTMSIVLYSATQYRVSEFEYLLFQFHPSILEKNLIFKW